MPHGIEFVNGQPMIALRSQPAWHGLANYIAAEDEELTLTEFLTNAGFADHHVVVEPEVLLDDEESSRQYFKTVREPLFDGGKRKVLGRGLTERYTPFQVQTLGETLDYAVDYESGRNWESAMLLNDGLRAAITLRLPGGMLLGPDGQEDKINRYLFGVTSFDGSSSTKLFASNVRGVCQNTVNWAIGGAENIFSIKHTATADERAKGVRKALNLSTQYLTQMDEFAQKLYSTPATDADMQKVLNVLFPTPDEDASPSAKTRWGNAVGTIWTLYRFSPTLDNARGTAWGVLNTLTEFEDYYTSTRGDKKGENRLVKASGFDTLATAQRKKIADVVSTLITV